MFRDFKTVKFRDNIEKHKAYLRRENKVCFDRIENILKASVYDKSHLTDKESRDEKNRQRAL